MKELFLGNISNASEFELSGPEMHHCIRVTRHLIGDEILVSNFEGTIWNACIEQIQKDICKGRLLSIYKEDPAYHSVHIAISLTQAVDRFEWFLEKSVEMGIHKITPLICARTERRRWNMDRFTKIMLAASKQTHRALVPSICEPIKFTEVFSNDSSNQRFICHCENDDKIHLAHQYTPDSGVMILIGPEGDFTKDEIEYAKSHNSLGASLGEFRLRTETAGLFALQICQTLQTLYRK